MRFLSFNLPHHWHHHHHDQHLAHQGHPAHHPAHGRGRYGGRHRADDDVALSLLAARLDLDAAQTERLNQVLSLLQHQRRSLGAALHGDELQQLFASENFDRVAAQAQLDGRLDQLRAAGPALLAALGDFFDGLDFDQQQALRFQLRGRRGRHNGRHDASTAAD